MAPEETAAADTDDETPAPFRLPSADDIEKLQQGAHREGYAAGYEEGDAAIEKSKSDLDQVNIVSRKTIPAPEGDLAELLPTKPQSSTKTTPISKPWAVSTPTPLETTAKEPVIAPPPAIDSDLFVGARPQAEKMQSQTTTISIKATTTVEPNTEPNAKPVLDRRALYGARRPR